MVGHARAQLFRVSFLYAAAICGVFFAVIFPLHAALIPPYQATAGISTGPQAPSSIAVDKQGRLYVIESSSQRLDIYNHTGNLSGRLTGLDNPLSVAVDRRGRLYVGSGGTGSVEIYDSQTLERLGELGIGDKEFIKPTAITIDNDGRVYVADAKAGVVKVFNPNGSLNFIFGNHGANAGQLRHPVSLLINTVTDEILVLDFANGVAGRVQVFDLYGAFKRSFIAVGAEGRLLVRPIGMVMDEQSRLYLSDAYSSQVAVYDYTGVYLGNLSSEASPLHTPLGMAYAANQARLYVASLNNSRIATFDLLDLAATEEGESPTPPFDLDREDGAPPIAKTTSPTPDADTNCSTITSCTATDGPYTLSAITRGFGQIEPAGESLAEAGTDIHFQITPDPGYRIADVKVDGESVGVSMKYAFTNIRADHALTVDFVPVLEVGQLQVDHRWKRVEFKTPFIEPVVVVNPATHNDSDPVVVRIRNLDQAGFEIRLQEWEYLDSIHDRETVSYLVMEQGVHELANGTLIEAGYFDHATAQPYRRVAFKQALSTTPVVLTSVTSVNKREAVTGRIQKVKPEDFTYRLQEQELSLRIRSMGLGNRWQEGKSNHRTRSGDFISHQQGRKANRKQPVSERIDYIAWPPSAGLFGGLLFEAASPQKRVNHHFQKLSFSSSFTHAPAFIADMQSANDSDTANLRMHNAGISDVELQVDEEQSRDRETRHASETVGYLAFGVPLSNPNSDSDDDGIADQDEIDTYGSMVLAQDSDDDGLVDGAERDFWGDAWGLDYDGDGLTNLLDWDADGDGHSDGAELQAGSDPANTASVPHSAKVQ